MSRTLDFTTGRGWGNDFGVRRVHDGGKEIDLHGWSTPPPSEGDYLILPNRDSSTRYLVLHVDRPGDPPDMWFARARFAPRRRVQLHGHHPVPHDRPDDYLLPDSHLRLAVRAAGGEAVRPPITAAEALALAKAALEDDASIQPAPWSQHEREPSNIIDDNGMHVCRTMEPMDGDRDAEAEAIVAMRSREPMLARWVMGVLDDSAPDRHRFLLRDPRRAGVAYIDLATMPNRGLDAEALRAMAAYFLRAADEVA